MKFTSIENKRIHFKKHVEKQKEPFDKINGGCAVENEDRYEYLASKNVEESKFFYPTKKSKDEKINFGYISVYPDYPEIKPLTIVKPDQPVGIITFFIPASTHLELFFLSNYLLQEKMEMIVKNPELFLLINTKEIINPKEESSFFCDLYFETYKDIKTEGDYRIKEKSQKVIHFFCKKQKEKLECKQTEKDVKNDYTGKDIFLYQFLKEQIERKNNIETERLSEHELKELLDFFINNVNCEQLKLIREKEDEDKTPLKDKTPLFVYFEYYLRTVIVESLCRILKKENENKENKDLEAAFDQETKEYGKLVKELFSSLLESK